MDRSDLRIILLAILLRLAVALSILLVHNENGFLRPDSGGYLALAEGLSSHGQFAVSPAPTSAPLSKDIKKTSPEIRRTPGYPLFLAPGSWLGQPMLLAIILQALLSGLTAAGIMRGAKLLGLGASSGRWAALLFAIDPSSIIFNNTILTETLFTTLQIFACIALLHTLKTGSRHSAAASGVFLAASIFVRPINIYLPILAAAACIINNTHAHRVRWTQALLLLTLTLVPCAGWIWRNHALGGPATFSCITGENLYYYEYAAVVAKRDGRSWYEVRQELLDQKSPMTNNSHKIAWQSTPEGYAWLVEQSRKGIMQHPWILARIHMAGMGRMLFDPASAEWMRAMGAYPENGGMLNTIVSQGLLSTLIELMRERPGFFALTIMLGLENAFFIIIGFWGAWSVRRRGLWLCLIGLILYHLALGSGPQTQARFRVPIVPLLALLCAASRKKTRAPNEAPPNKSL